MVPFLIVLSIIVAIVIFVVIISAYTKYVEECKENYVKKYSKQLEEVKRLNNIYHYRRFSIKRIIDYTKLDSKRAFDTFDYKMAIKRAFFNKKAEIKNAIDQVTKEKAEIEEYYKKIKSIPPTCYENLPKDKHMTEAFFRTFEESLVSKEIQRLKTGLTVIVRWSYTSPQGRRSYEDHEMLDYHKAVELFDKIFGKQLEKENSTEEQQGEYREKFKEESDVQFDSNQIDDSAKTVSKQLTKSLYKISDVIEIYKNLGVNATKTLAEVTLINSGYKKSKYRGFYIHSSINNVRDLILASANELGLITYENQIKDEEYDNAIAKLEKEGRIVPIDNLHFLKVGKNLNYCGITLDEIDEFESLLLKYSRKQLFVSVKQIKENIDCLVTRIEFDECFIATIIKYCGFLSPVPGIDKLYTTIQKPQRIMFLEWLLKGKKSVDAFDLIYDLKELYGIEYSIYSILYDLDKNETKLYYNQEMEKIYSNKEFFFEELEGII